MTKANNKVDPDTIGGTNPIALALERYGLTAIPPATPDAATTALSNDALMAAIALGPVRMAEAIRLLQAFGSVANATELVRKLILDTDKPPALRTVLTAVSVTDPNAAMSAGAFEKIQELRAQVHSLEESLSGTRDEASVVQTAYNELQQTHGELQRTHDATVLERDTLKEGNKTKDSQLRDARDTIASLENRLGESEQQRNAIQIESERKESKIAQLTREHTNTIERIKNNHEDETKSLTSKNTKKVNGLENEIATLKQDLEVERSVRQGRENDLSTQKELTSDLLAQLETAIGEKAAAQDFAASLPDQMTALVRTQMEELLAKTSVLVKAPTAGVLVSAADARIGTSLAQYFNSQRGHICMEQAQFLADTERLFHFLCSSAGLAANKNYFIINMNEFPDAEGRKNDTAIRVSYRASKVNQAAIEKVFTFIVADSCFWLYGREITASPTAYLDPDNAYPQTPLARFDSDGALREFVFGNKDRNTYSIAKGQSLSFDVAAAAMVSRMVPVENTPQLLRAMQISGFSVASAPNGPNVK